MGGGTEERWDSDVCDIAPGIYERLKNAHKIQGRQGKPAGIHVHAYGNSLFYFSVLLDSSSGIYWRERELFSSWLLNYHGTVGPVTLSEMTHASKVEWVSLLQGILFLSRNDSSTTGVSQKLQFVKLSGEKERGKKKKKQKRSHLYLHL